MDPEELVDGERRLNTNAVIQFGHRLVYAKKGEFLENLPLFLPVAASVVFSASIRKQPKLVQVTNRNAITLTIGKLSKTISNLAKNTGKMSQQLFDNLKVLLRMEAGCQIKLPNGQVVNIFCPTKDFKCPETWHQSVVRQINALVQYVRSDLGFEAQHVLAIVLLLFLASWLVIDLCQINNECKDIEKLTEAEKREYLKILENMDKILDKICGELKNGSNIHVHFKELLQPLIDETVKLISKIGESTENIKERIKALEEKESSRRIMRNLLATTTGIIFGTTYWFWNQLTLANRAVGILGGGVAAGGAATMMISLNTLMQAQKKQKEVLDTMNNLNEKLLEIHEYTSDLEYQPSQHQIFLIQFEAYKKSLQDFQTRFQ